MILIWMETTMGPRFPCTFNPKKLLNQNDDTWNGDIAGSLVEFPFYRQPHAFTYKRVHTKWNL